MLICTLYVKIHFHLFAKSAIWVCRVNLFLVNSSLVKELLNYRIEDCSILYSYQQCLSTSGPFSYPFQHLVLKIILMLAINSGYLNLILTYISLMANDVEHLLMYLMSSECPFGKMFASFLITLFLMLSFESSLYSLDVSLRLDMCFANSFSGCILSFCP